jgi:RNA polymerase sigma-70 factor (ECF subfamily)
MYSGLQPELRRYASALLGGDASAADDVVDEAFLDIWRAAAAYSGEGSAAGWVRRIVRNKSIDWIRRRRERPLSSDDAAAQRFEQNADPGDTPEAIAMKISRAEELREALNTLKPEFREVLWLCYFEDKSIAEIAEMTGVPENTVKTRLFHARKALKAILPPRPDDEGSWP